MNFRFVLDSSHCASGDSVNAVSILAEPELRAKATFPLVAPAFGVRHAEVTTAAILKPHFQFRTIIVFDSSQLH